MTTEHRLTRIAGKLWPDLDTLDERRARLSELVGIIYGMFLTVLGLGWLVASTDMAVLRAEWPALLLVLLLAAVDRFAGEAPQYDDVTLLIVVRDSRKIENEEQ